MLSWGPCGASGSGVSHPYGYETSRRETGGNVWCRGESRARDSYNYVSQLSERIGVLIVSCETPRIRWLMLPEDVSGRRALVAEASLRSASQDRGYLAVGFEVSERVSRE